MKHIAKLALVGAMSMAVVGCGDSYNDDKKKVVAQDTTFSSLSRDVKYLTDTNNRALYTFDDDALNVSNCDADCQKNWPLFTGGNTESEDIVVIGDANQLAYRKHPLYYFVNDTEDGDVKGDQIPKWHLIYPVANTTDSQTALSEEFMTQVYLTDGKGRALYTFDNDTDGDSNCYDGCEVLWPVFHVEDISGLPAGFEASDFATITRDVDQASEPQKAATTQTTYKGQPLYYFKDDNMESGKTDGDWYKGVWHLVEVSADKRSPYTSEAAAAGEKIFTDPGKCARCHGADGQTEPLGVDNVIAKYGDAALIEQKLRDMRDNGNPNNRDSAMVSIAEGLPDAAITNLSAFIATLKK